MEGEKERYNKIWRIGFIAFPCGQKKVNLSIERETKSYFNLSCWILREE